jgi:3alpha(or 20beta)-hydroxysteroid dehydrogenase
LDLGWLVKIIAKGDDVTGRLDGRVAVITGGARGQGAAEAELFVNEGAKVIIADVAAAEGKRLADALGEGVRFVELDVADEMAWEQAVRSAVTTFGGIDVLVNNAAIPQLGPIVSLSLDAYLKVVMVNQVGVFLGMRAVIPEMTKRGGGSIVNISSIDGLLAHPFACAYVASKFAVRGMTKVAALELASAGIRVNSVHPGVVRTTMLESVPGVSIESLVSPSIPMRRAAEPEELASVTLFLASAESSYCTGGEFVVDGGWTAGIPTNVELDAALAQATPF